MRFTASVLVASALAAVGAFASLEKPQHVRQVIPSLTNGERFARGLPPAAPRRIGSRTGSARRSGPSGGFTSANQAVEVIATSNSSSVGYLYNTLNSQGIYTLTASGDTVLQVSYSANTLASENLSGPSEGNLLYVGPISADGTTNYDSATPGYLWAGATQQTDSGATPDSTTPNSYQADANKNYASESTVFSVASDGTITTSWVNTDGSTVTITPFLYADQVAWTNDISAYTSDTQIPVSLRLVAVPSGGTA